MISISFHLYHDIRLVFNHFSPIQHDGKEYLKLRKALFMKAVNSLGILQPESKDIWCNVFLI